MKKKMLDYNGIYLLLCLMMFVQIKNRQDILLCNDVMVKIYCIYNLFLLGITLEAMFYLQIYYLCFIVLYHYTFRGIYLKDYLLHYIIICMIVNRFNNIYTYTFFYTMAVHNITIEKFPLFNLIFLCIFIYDMNVINIIVEILYFIYVFYT